MNDGAEKVVRTALAAIEEAKAGLAAAEEAMALLLPRNRLQACSEAPEYRVEVSDDMTVKEAARLIGMSPATIR